MVRSSAKAECTVRSFAVMCTCFILSSKDFVLESVIPFCVCCCVAVHACVRWCECSELHGVRVVRLPRGCVAGQPRDGGPANEFHPECHRIVSVGRSQPRAGHVHLQQRLHLGQLSVGERVLELVSGARRTTILERPQLNNNAFSGQYINTSEGNRQISAPNTPLPHSQSHPRILTKRKAPAFSQLQYPPQPSAPRCPRA